MGIEKDKSIPDSKKVSLELLRPAITKCKNKTSQDGLALKMGVGVCFHGKH